MKAGGQVATGVMASGMDGLTASRPVGGLLPMLCLEDSRNRMKSTRKRHYVVFDAVEFASWLKEMRNPKDSDCLRDSGNPSLRRSS